jgi:glucose-6-phosphate 1-dehydrogenase
VPFYVRAGKSLARTVTEVTVQLRNPPQVVFTEKACAACNYGRFRLSPEVAIAVGARAKQPGYEYEPGSWGPSEADRLLEAAGGWNTPQ